METHAPPLERDEWARSTARPEAYGIACLHAKFVTHAFPPHVHDYYAIGVIEVGHQTFTCRGGKHATPEGGIFVVHPDEPHTGEPATERGFTYRTFYPSVALMQHAADELRGRAASLPFFPDPVIRDTALARRLIALHDALVGPTTTLEAETRVLGAFTAMIARHAGTRSISPLGRERAATRRVRMYIEERYDRDLTLAELSGIAALSPYHLARVFRAECGLPPHAYLESIRIRAAQRLLAEGMPPATVACTVGYADQSHLTHRFKRFLGITPGAYARGRKIPQDSAPV